MHNTGYLFHSTTTRPQLVLHTHGACRSPVDLWIVLSCFWMSALHMDTAWLSSTYHSSWTPPAYPWVSNLSLTHSVSEYPVTWTLPDYPWMSNLAHIHFVSEHPLYTVVTCTWTLPDYSWMYTQCMSGKLNIQG